MASGPVAITAEKFAEALVAAGVVPGDQKIFRIVIEAKTGNLLLVYVEYVGDERILDVIPTLDGIEVRHG